MARPPHSQRDDAISLIRRLVDEHGVKEGVRLARLQFLNVAVATWGRWRQIAVGNVSGANVDAVIKLADHVHAQIPHPAHLAPFMSDPLPATRRALDFWRMLDELESDARLLREFALTKTAEGRTKVRVPYALRDAHRMRCDLIRLALRQAEAAHGVDRAAKFFDAVVSAIETESPETARRVMERLNKVQTESELRGF